MPALQWSWKIFLIVGLLNTTWMGGIYFAQYIGRALPARGSIIPGTGNAQTGQKFLYAQDFRVMTWGDLLGLWLVTNVFIHLVFEDLDNLWWGLLIGLAGGILTLRMWLGADHKPDYGFPAIGQISFPGILHQIYFAFSFGAAMVALWKFGVKLYWGYELGPVIWVGLAGAIFYICCSIWDHWEGNFEPLRKVTQGRALFLGT